MNSLEKIEGKIEEKQEENETSAWDELSTIAFNESNNIEATEEKPANVGENAETKSTDYYEKEITALGDKFEEPDYLNEPISNPDVIEYWKSNNLIQPHKRVIQEWVQSNSASQEEAEYKKSLADMGFKKKLFYRSTPDISKDFDAARESIRKTITDKRTNDFLKRQDVIEQEIKSELKEYITEPDNPVAKMEGDNLPLPSRFEVIKHWIENGDINQVRDHSDQIKEWLAMDDGDDKEKRYRAFVRTLINGDIKRWKSHDGKTENLRKSNMIPMPYAIAWSKCFEEQNKKIISPEYLNLPDEEKAKKWEEAKHEYIESLKKKIS